MPRDRLPATRSRARSAKQRANFNLTTESIWHSAHGEHFLLRTGILNPAVRSLLGRVRHTNTLVIADRGFPFWPEIETVDLSLIDGIPTVQQVLDAVVREWKAGQAWMAEEFQAANGMEAMRGVEQVLRGVPLVFEPHYELKRRVPGAIGLIRTGDTVQYANIVLESA